MVFNEAQPITLVFLHGWGMNKMVWQPLLSKHDFSHSGKVESLQLDLPGFGYNQFVVEPDSYSLDSLSSHIEKQLPDNSIIVGWSLAGLIAQTLVNKLSAKVIGQVQVCSTPKFTQTEDWPGIKPIVLQQFAKQLKQDHKALLKRFLAIQCMGLDNAKSVYKEMYEALTQHPLSNEEALTQSLALLSSTDLRGRLVTGSINTPSLRIFGGLDSLVPKKALPLIQQIYRNDEFYLIDKASHAPFISHPDNFASILNTFTFNNFLK